MLLGTNINEGEIVNSVKECQESCQDNNDCKAFTFRTFQQESKCWLKRDAKKRMSQQSTISGPKNCRKLKNYDFIVISSYDILRYLIILLKSIMIYYNRMGLGRME